MAQIIEYRRENIERIASLFRKGKLGVIPCDTIYGISGCVRDDVRERIYEVKERPQSKSFIVLMTKAQLSGSGLIVPEDILSLWPCSLTAVLGREDGTTEAVRVPSDPFLEELLPLSGPLFSTSVNISGRPSLLTYEEILPVFDDRVDFIVRAEKCGGGKSSTLVDATKKPYRILRQGSYELKL